MNGNNLWETAFFQLRDLKIYGAAAAGGPAIIGDRNACDALLVDCFVRDVLRLFSCVLVVLGNSWTVIGVFGAASTSEKWTVTSRIERLCKIASFLVHGQIAIRDSSHDSAIHEPIHPKW